MQKKSNLILVKKESFSEPKGEFNQKWLNKTRSLKPQMKPTLINNLKRAPTRNQKEFSLWKEAWVLSQVTKLLRTKRKLNFLPLNLWLQNLTQPKIRVVLPQNRQTLASSLRMKQRLMWTRICLQIQWFVPFRTFILKKASPKSVVWSQKLTWKMQKIQTWNVKLNNNIRNLSIYTQISPRKRLRLFSRISAILKLFSKSLRIRRKRRSVMGKNLPW